MKIYQSVKPLNIHSFFFKVTDTSPIAFGPRIDVERKDPFLPMKPEDIIKSKSFSQIPFITGVTANEAGFAIASKIDL